MFARSIESKGDARFYSALGVLWVGLAIWQIVNLFRVPALLESNLGGGALYAFLTLALLAWSVFNAVGIGKDLRAYRDRVKAGVYDG